MTENAVKVFISYSHKDEDLRDRLDTHLSNLRWDGVISSWYDRQLTAGTEWDEKIKAELEAADIILLLISPDFIASKYCRDVEIPLSLQRHEAKQAFVVPIILRPFDWFTAPFAKLQAFPKDAKPVTTWANQDEAFLSIAQGIRTAVQLLRAERQQLAAQQQAAEQQYRQQVEEALEDGVISLVERDTLDELREELGLPVEVAAAIEAEVFEPFRRYGENLEKYQQTLNRLIAGGHYPFSAQIEQDLSKRQRDLGLKPEDVAQVAQPILDQAELAEQARKKQIAEAEKLRELERSLEQLQHPQLEVVKQRLKQRQEKQRQQEVAKQQLQRFEFQVPTVNVDRTTIEKPGLFGKKTETITTCNITYQRGQADYCVEDLGGGVTLELVKIPGGTFRMGAPESEVGRSADEGPQHSVTVSPCFLGKFAVTQAQWRAVAALPKVKIDLEPDPAKFKGANRPVEQVSWEQSVEFCDRLSRKTNKQYRLPSEAEWEYACRAGTNTPFYFGETITPELANYDGNYTYGAGPKGVYREQTAEVGTFLANPFGLYDMHGNVREWCADHWHDSYAGAPTDGTAWIIGGNSERRIIRGGSWLDNPAYCRAAYRYYRSPASRNNDVGFRLLCSVFPGLF